MQQSSWGAPLSCCWDSKQHDITSEIWFIVVVAVRLPVSLTQFFTFVQWHMKSEKKSSNDDDDGEHSQLQLLVVQLVRVQIAMRRYRVYSAISSTMNGGNWKPSHHRHSRMRKKDGILSLDIAARGGDFFMAKSKIKEWEFRNKNESAVTSAGSVQCAWSRPVRLMLICIIRREKHIRSCGVCKSAPRSACVCTW